MTSRLWMEGARISRPPQAAPPGAPRPRWVENPTDRPLDRLGSVQEMREALFCIRCGACLNACPVYRKIGGRAYGWVYGGPIGALITPQFTGLEQGRELPFASSLCGACREVCPVKINIPDLLLELRSQAQQQGPAPQPEDSPVTERTAMRLWAWVMKHSSVYSFAANLARLGQRAFARDGWIKNVPTFPLSRWTDRRDFPALAPKSFRDRWEEIQLSK